MMIIQEARAEIDEDSSSWNIIRDGVIIDVDNDIAGDDVGMDDAMSMDNLKGGGDISDDFGGGGS